MKGTHKLILLLALMLAGLSLMIGINLTATKNLMLEDRKATLKNIVQANKKILEFYNGKIVSGAMPLKAAQEAAYETIRQVRYNATDYVFGYDFGGDAHIAPKAESIDAISSAIKQVNDISTTVASAVEEQNAATHEISRSANQTAQNTDEVTQNIIGIKIAAEETNVASVQMLATAGRLAEESETLRGTVEEFIGRICRI